jgi:uncharacterized protein
MLIYETIVSTCGADGRVHLAPMGLREIDGRFLLAPFRPSTTLENLKRQREAVVNLTDDVRVFAGCLTGRRDWPTRPAREVCGGVLAQALTHMELRIERVEEDEQRPRFYCRLLLEEQHGPFRGFNRAQAAVLEAAVLVSRLHWLAPEKIEREIEYLTIAIDKTAGERERAAWGWLMEHIREFRRTQASA